MAKNDRKSEENNELEIESAATDPSDTIGESTSSEASPQETAAEEPSEEQVSASTESEDLLDDVRRSLIEEDETDKSKKEAKWWRRLGRKQKNPEPEPSAPAAEIDLPAASLEVDSSLDQKQATEPDEYAEQIDDLIDMLKAEHQESAVETPSVVTEAEIPPEPEPEIDLEQLKEQAFRPRTAGEGESESDVRSIALEGGEEVFVEVEAKATDAVGERLKGLENALKPYRSVLYMTLAFLGVVMAVVASLLIFNAYRQSRPQPTQQASNLPYPVAVSLPGGWSFNLGRGTLQGDTWEPSGPEWLQGTEVCRWVSLPWSLQLEAVIRTLEHNDPIQLVMSNNDKLVYGVYSVSEMTPEEIQKVDTTSPCLLLILTQSESQSESQSGKRWVLTAVP
jgi:hypothetical protein